MDKDAHGKISGAKKTLLATWTGQITIRVTLRGDLRDRVSEMAELGSISTRRVKILFGIAWKGVPTSDA